MIVSYVNRLKEATLSATNENINRPVTYLIHNFLELAFYADDNDTEITIEFDEGFSIDHIAFDYHNLDEMTIEFYNIFDVLLHTEVITVEENCNFHTFDTIENVRTIIISCNTYANDLYIGGISMGEYFEFPDFRQSLQGEIIIGGTLNISPGGQASGNMFKNLKPYTLNFAFKNNTERIAIETYLEYIKKIPHFINFYEDGDDYFKPFYGCVTNSRVPMNKRKISTWEWDFSLTYQEVR